MTPWIALLVPALVLLVADAMGWIDLTTRPLKRMLKWMAIALWAWFLPQLASKVFRFEINPELLGVWKLIVLAFLLGGLIFTLAKWIWSYYAPPPEGCRRCPECREPILKVMIECPACGKKI